MYLDLVIERRFCFRFTFFLFFSFLLQICFLDHVMSPCGIQDGDELIKTEYVDVWFPCLVKEKTGV